MNFIVAKSSSAERGLHPNEIGRLLPRGSGLACRDGRKERTEWMHHRSLAGKTKPVAHPGAAWAKPFSCSAMHHGAAPRIMAQHAYQICKTNPPAAMAGKGNAKNTKRKNEPIEMSGNVRFCPCPGNCIKIDGTNPSAAMAGEGAECLQMEPQSMLKIDLPGGSLTV